MNIKTTALISLLALFALTGTKLNAQQNKSNVSVFIENQKDFIEESGDLSIFHFHMLYDDRYISAKEVQAMANSIPEIIKFGIKNQPNTKDGKYACYIKTSIKNQNDVFSIFLKKFNCTKLSLEGEEVSVKSFNEKINNLK
ncbi:MAG: hypothetical protein U9R19_02735 [Bacteroidota bacterium]|nr:hypothetical protein [Bacteroidota bacterium]